jgi:hypothetical protein
MAEVVTIQGTAYHMYKILETQTNLVLLREQL